jgi:teichuronic acid biosynthesis glycosyltransferase TuaC
MPKGRFVIAGEGAERAAIEARRAELGLQDRVTLLGQLPHDDLPDLYGACDIVAFPSRWETFGLALVEATFQGVPIVASTIPSSTEILAGAGSNIAFVPDWNPRTWATALQRMIDNPDAREAARAFAPVIQSRYGEAGMLEAYRVLYQRLMG